MGRRCRNTPAAVQRQLRQEANFGCCLCGRPILDNAHIIPYHLTHAFPPEDMLALCPTCHRIADDGDYSEKYLRELKDNPHNKTSVTERFLIEGNDLILNLGGNKFINSHRILVINDFEIIIMKKESEGYITLNLNLFDEYNRLIGIIDENKWTVDTSLLWDLQYRPKHLRILNAPRKISSEIKIEKGEVFINGQLYFLGQPIVINKNEVWIGNESFFGTIRGCVFENTLDDVIHYQLKTKPLRFWPHDPTVNSVEKTR